MDLSLVLFSLSCDESDSSGVSYDADRRMLVIHCCLIREQDGGKITMDSKIQNLSDSLESVVGVSLYLFDSYLRKMLQSYVPCEYSFNILFLLTPLSTNACFVSFPFFFGVSICTYFCISGICSLSFLLNYV